MHLLQEKIAISPITMKSRGEVSFGSTLSSSGRSMYNKNSEGKLKPLLEKTKETQPIDLNTKSSSIDNMNKINIQRLLNKNSSIMEHTKTQLIDLNTKSSSVDNMNINLNHAIPPESVNENDKPIMPKTKFKLPSPKTKRQWM